MCAGTRPINMVSVSGHLGIAGSEGHRGGTSSRPFISTLRAEDAAELQARMRDRVACPGATLLHAGAPGTSVVLVLHGHVKIVTRAADRREVVLAMAGPGELLGELSVLDGRARSAAAVAVDQVRYGSMSGDDFQEFLAERPSASVAFMRMLARRMRETDRELVMLATEDTLGRTAARLCELAERYGNPAEDGIRIELAMTQEELAAWTGGSRESVARALRLMRSLGWVTTSRRTIVVLDMNALRARGPADERLHATA
jgi:CRP-like cAMP-binding protein